MKKIVLFVVSLLICFSCQKKGNDTVSLKIDCRLTGEVLLAGGNHCRFHDLAIVGDYYIFLSNQGDTLISVYSRHDMSFIGAGMQEGEPSVRLYPSFVHYNYAEREEKNRISVWNNTLRRIDQYDLRKTDDTVFTPVASTSFDKKMIESRFPLITEEETYAVGLTPNPGTIFFSFHPRTGFYHVPAYPLIPHLDYRRTRSNPHASAICVNEEKGVIVAAARYINIVNFYDLNGDMIKPMPYGDSFIFPEFDPSGEVHNVEKSIKCFLDISCSMNYVYCLYDGSSNYSTLSTILVFNWEGMHIRNLQVDRSIRNLQVDADDRYLITLAENEEEGRDVVRYKL
ncbi:TolB-like 6-bladed beta-propeller domain-containing protein [Parabacteroides sp. OttesenSCG-928-J18]|nr:TolB-like 6-bladed beta-propeller domain-containing protein [Parabacteroides sp. OttesenSCG-928-J18]